MPSDYILKVTLYSLHKLIQSIHLILTHSKCPAIHTSQPAFTSRSTPSAYNWAVTLELTIVQISMPWKFVAFQSKLAYVQHSASPTLFNPSTSIVNEQRKAYKNIEKQSIHPQQSKQRILKNEKHCGLKLLIQNDQPLATTPLPLCRQRRISGLGRLPSLTSATTMVPSKSSKNLWTTGQI